MTIDHDLSTVARPPRGEGKRLTKQVERDDAGATVAAQAGLTHTAKSPRLPHSIFPRAKAGGAHTADADEMQVASAVIYLPLPTSTNRMYQRTKRGRVSLSDKYKDWKRCAATVLNVANFPSFSGHYGLSMTLHPGAGDLDNRVKTLNDLLQDRKIILNDKLNDEIHLSRSAAIEPGMCRVELWHMD